MGKTLIKLLPILLILFACKSQQPAGESGDAKESSESIEITKVAGGGYSGISEESQQLIKSSDEFKKLWVNINSNRTPEPPLPKVNFEENYLIACFMGTRTSGGYSIEISSANKNGTDLKVGVVYNGPGANCFVTDALTQPFFLGTVNKADIKTASFNIKKIAKDC